MIKLFIGVDNLISSLFLIILLDLGLFKVSGDTLDPELNFIVLAIISKF